MPAVPNGDSPTILIADDDPGVRKFIKDCLNPRGIATTEAQDGVAACEQAEASPPALILLDIFLPKRDGYAVLLHLASTEATRQIPVILMSGEPDNEHVAKMLGARGFMAKPFTVAALVSTVEAVLHSEAR